MIGKNNNPETILNFLYAYLLGGTTVPDNIKFETNFINLIIKLFLFYS